MIDDKVIETFVRGFCFTRSFTHPYLPERVDGLRVMRDAPRKSGDRRVEEWVTCGVDPRQIDRTARKHSRGRFGISFIHSIDEPEQPVRKGFKSLGYRLQTTEALMIHDLQRIPQFRSHATIRRVTDSALANRLAKVALSRQILPEHLVDDTPLRQYVAMIGDEIVGWVRSIQVGDATWCSNMQVRPPFRRRGIARSMLCRMLREDREAGAEQAVLLASHTGARLYPVVGYQQTGTLFLFKPKSR